MYGAGREAAPRRAVLSEIESLADAGFREITLLGQNVNSYRNEDVGFPELLRKASEAVGERCRLRFVTSNPRDLTTELVSVMASADNICNQFHLPAQSGSDRVLRAMNRGYTRKGYIEKVNMLREAMPDIVLSTDMISGFPGKPRRSSRNPLHFLRRYGSTTPFSSGTAKGRAPPRWTSPPGCR